MRRMVGGCGRRVLRCYCYPMDIGVDIDSSGVPMGHVQWFTRSFFWMRGVISGLLKESKKGRERGRRVW